MQPKIIFIALLLCGWGVALQAQATDEAGPAIPTYWEEVDELDLYLQKREQVLIPDRFRLLQLDLDAFATLLPQGETTNKRTALVELPLPDGSFRTFECYYESVMHPELAAKFPMIRSYAGQEVGGTAELTFAFSPLGLHAFILEAGHSPVKIEAVSMRETAYYLSYYEEELSGGLSLHCAADDLKTHTVDGGQSKAVAAGDCQLRTYDLAVATTAEYTASFIGPGDPDGTIGALASITNLLTIVNPIFQREFAIRLQLIANNNAVLFTDPDDDLTDGDQGTMADENEDIMNDNIGSGNFDIGHVFGTNPGNPNSGSGVSKGAGTICDNGDKARAATVMNPVNPSAFSNLIMHEFGHQLGANHTFNEASAGNCGNGGQLNSGTAFEPGSGSTLMSYSGGCGASNVTPAGNTVYFHAISLQEVSQYTVSGTGNTCATITPSGNSAPVVLAGADFTVPVNTPFRLSALGGDADGDNLTYCWEQMNNELITHPPAANAVNGPVFRSFFPSTSRTRYFPQLPAILNSAIPTPWEVLPSVSRTMNFRVTVRDNATPTGCTAEDDMVVTFADNAGPFRITSIGTDPTCLFAEENTTIDWDVANTTAPPVNCANVDIWLSLDGGQNFDILLANDTPNDGSEQVFIPEDAITMQGRIMVIGSGNIFLDINNSDIHIDCPVDLVVTDNPTTGTYRARERIEGSGPATVPAFGWAEFLAGEEVLLLPDFTAETNSSFWAAIQPCNHCGSPSMPLVGDTEEQPRIYIHYLDEPSEEETRTSRVSWSASAYPNPFRDEVSIAVELADAQTVRLQMVDLNGRPMPHAQWMGELPRGRHRIDLPTRELAAGVYFCQVFTDQGMELIRLVKMKD